VLGLLILILWPVSSFALWSGTIVIGFSIASAFATGIALAEQRLRLTGSLTGWILVGSGIAGMVFPWLIGQLFERISPRVTMPILMVITILAFVLLFVLILSKRKAANPPV
jgi:fucose permease